MFSPYYILTLIISLLISGAFLYFIAREQFEEQKVRAEKKEGQNKHGSLT